MSQGSLIIVGSGIRSIAHLTLEAIMHIEKADKVFYCVGDPVTAGYIKRKNKTATDLYEYYANSKPRDETYIQMAEVMLGSVRDGLNVVGVFYGHAGNFVAPSRRALTIARKEGYKAVMLPGISAEDCLFADLLIDPSYPGAQTVEATDLVIRGRQLQTSSHVIIYQVGCVGKIDFNFKGIENDQFHYLVQLLEKEYGPNHSIVNYKAAVSPLVEPTIQRYIVADLLRADVRKTIDSVSTFYIPPKTMLPISNTDAIAGAAWISQARQLIHPPLWADPSRDVPSLYGPRENEVIAQIKSHTTPGEYRPYAASPAMQAVMEKLYLNPESYTAYTASPEDFTRSVGGLLPLEAQALASGDPNLTNVAMLGEDPNNYQSVSPLILKVVVIVIGLTEGLEGSEA